MKLSTLLRLSAGVAVLAVAAPVLSQGPRARATARSASTYRGQDKASSRATISGPMPTAPGASAPRSPPTRRASGRHHLTDEAEAKVRKILDDMAANPAKYGATGKQVGDYYASWMDEAGDRGEGHRAAQALSRPDRRGEGPDRPAGRCSPPSAMPRRSRSGSSRTSPTRRTTPASSVRAAWACRATITCCRARSMTAIRKAYRAYIQQMQELAGIPDASAKADAIFALETAMAKEQWSPAQSRDIAKLNDPETLAGLKAKAPEFDWALMLKTAGLESAPTVIMANNTALTATGQDLRRDAAPDVEGLCRLPLRQRPCDLPAQGVRRREVRLLRQDAGRRSRRSATAGSAASQLINGALGEAVGKLYVERYYPPASRGQDGRADRESARRVSRAHRRLDLDGRCDAQGGAGQARRVRSAHRPSRSSISTIRRLKVGARRSARQRDARGRIPAPAATVALSQAGRPDAVGHDAADGERLLQPADQPDHLPGRDPAAAVSSTQMPIRRSITARSAR